MEQILIQLAKRALVDQVVAAQTLANGLRLLIYPLERGLIVGVGFERDLACRVYPDSLLQRRSENISRFGAWLPSMLVDGSFYVIRRIEYYNPDDNLPVLTEDDLIVAQELVS